MIIFYQTIFSQKYVSYFDFEFDGYGIKDKKTGVIVITPKYKQIIDLNDSLFAVKWLDSYGIIDIRENYIIKPTKYPVYLDHLDTVTQRFLEESSNHYRKPRHLYYIDTDRNCIPTIEMPCPYWKEVKSDTVSKTVYYIQKSKYYRSINHLDSSLMYSDSAIYMENNIPNTYFNWVVNLLNDKDGEFIKNNDSIDRFLINKADSFLLKCNALSNDPYNIASIHNLRYPLHKYITCNKMKLNEIRKINRKNKIDVVRWGIFIFGGLNYNNKSEIEVGIGNGVNTLRNNFHFNYLGSIWSGLSYSKYLEKNINGIKLHIMSFLKPISWGIYPIYYTDFSHSDFIIRPEIGIGINYFTINAGYNYNIDKKFDFDKDINKLVFSLRFYFPLNKQKEFVVN